MEHESDGDITCNWHARYCHQWIGTGTGELGNKRSRYHPNYSIVEISQNTEKSPGDLRRLAVTQTLVRNHQLTLVSPLVRYLGPFLKWIREELKQMDQRIRKLITMNKALHPRDDVDRLYVSSREGERGTASIENSMNTSIK